MKIPIVLVLALLTAACTAGKKQEAAQSDSAALVGPPAATGSAQDSIVNPAGPMSATDTGTKSHPSATKKAKTGQAGGERDSAIEATFEMGADGKLHRIKR